MSNNLVESIKGLFSNEVISKASGYLGENEAGVNRAINAIIPTFLGGLMDKTSTPEGATTVARLAETEASSGNSQNPLTYFDQPAKPGPTTGTGLMNQLFGARAGAVTDMLSNFSAVKTSSINSLIALAGPVILGFLGRYKASNNLDPNGIASLLHEQNDNIRHALPSGLNLGAIFGGDTPSPAAHAQVHGRPAATSVSHHPVEVEEEPGNGVTWAILALFLALLGAGAWYLSHDEKHEEPIAHANAATSHDTTGSVAHHTEMVPARETLKVRLANGTEIDAYRGGIEDRLVTFLNTDYKTLGEDSLKTVWFDFDNLNFNTASAELTPESQKQVDNMTAILKAYPNATLKIGGYTDKVGNEAANKKLSADRANAVKAALTKAGVGGQVTSAEGYGSAFAKYPATAPETDRVKDRRVSVSVR
jgi:outer membrane protein OmpA-like peptidoglycan-associated protein